MIAYLSRKESTSSVRALEYYEPGVWVDAVAPLTNELDELAAQLGVERDLMQDALDPFEVPRVQEEKGIVYVFIRVPHGAGDDLITIPALLAIGPDFFLTVCAERLPLIERFVGGSVSYSTERRSQLFVKYMGELVTAYQYAVNAMSKRLRHKIGNIGQIQSKDILSLVASEGVINSFLAALQPMHTSLAQLTGGKILKMYDEDRDLVEDVQLAMGQTVEAARGHLQTAVNFREAYSVIVTNDLNRFVKLFTTLTILMMVPNLITSVWGMNIALPMQHYPHAFAIIVSATLIILVSLITFFARKRLF